MKKTIGTETILRDSWRAYRRHFTGLIRVTGPFLVAVIALNGVWYGDQLSEVAALLGYYSGRFLFQVIIILAGLKFLLGIQGVASNVTVTAILSTIAALIYTGIAVVMVTFIFYALVLAVVFGLAFLVPPLGSVVFGIFQGHLVVLLYVVPAFMLFVAAFLAPACVLIHKQSPLEAVATSTSLIRGHLLAASGCLLLVLVATGTLYWLIGASAELATGWGMPVWLAAVLSDIPVLLIGLFYLPLMQVMYSALMAARDGEPLPVTAGRAA